MSIEDIKRELEYLKSGSLDGLSDEQIAAREQLRESYERTNERKIDTRIKIFIGGFMMSRLDDSQLENLLDDVANSLNEKNKKVLENWRMKNYLK